MKKTLVMIVTLLISVSFAVAATAPKTVNLKEAWGLTAGKQKAVIFDHDVHSTQNKCTDCHDSDEGGKFQPAGEIAGNNDKNAAHNYCWTCHTKQGVKVGKTCTKCHTQK